MKGGWSRWSIIGRCAGGCVDIIVPSFHLINRVTSGLGHINSVLSSLNIHCRLVPISSNDNSNASDILRTLHSSIVYPIVLGSGDNGNGTLERNTGTSHNSLVLLLSTSLSLSPSTLPEFLRVVRSRGTSIMVKSGHRGSSRVSCPQVHEFTSSICCAVIHVLAKLPIASARANVGLFGHRTLLCTFSHVLIGHCTFSIRLLSVVRSTKCGITRTPVGVRFKDGHNTLAFKGMGAILASALTVFCHLEILKCCGDMRPIALPRIPPAADIVVTYPSGSTCLRRTVNNVGARAILPLRILIVPSRTFRGPAS